MNKILLLILLLFFQVCAVGEIKKIAHGVFYEHIVKTGDNPQSIHILTLNPKEVLVEIGLAHDKCASAETTLQMSKRKKAIAAINAGFFSYGLNSKLDDFIVRTLDRIGLFKYNAYPMYSLVLENKIISLSNLVTGAIGWNKTEMLFLFDTLKISCDLLINNKVYSIAGFNMPSNIANKIYTPEFDLRTPKSKQLIEIVIEKDKISKIIAKSNGNTLIPKNGFVFSAPKKSINLEGIKLGDYVDRKFNYTNLESKNVSHLWSSKDYVLGATPLLIKNGQAVSKILDYKASFYSRRHPRTAVGLLDNGNLVFLVVDGRQKFSSGFTIEELAKYMLNLGCYHALNLDGGGSSTMIIGNKVVNKPSGNNYTLIKKERPISTALLVKKR